MHPCLAIDRYPGIGTPALARELHDQVGRNLTALDLYLNAIRLVLPESEPAAEQIHTRLDASLDLLAQTADRIRNVMADLRPPVLDDMGLVATLGWHAAECAENCEIEISVEGQEPVPRLPSSVELALFRIVQEAPNNVTKHAQANRARIAARDGTNVRYLEPARGSRQPILCEFQVFCNGQRHFAQSANAGIMVV